MILRCVGGPFDGRILDYPSTPVRVVFPILPSSPTATPMTDDTVALVNIDGEWRWPPLPFTQATYNVDRKRGLAIFDAAAQ